MKQWQFNYNNVCKFIWIIWHWLDLKTSRVLWLFWFFREGELCTPKKATSIFASYAPNFLKKVGGTETWIEQEFDGVRDFFLHSSG